MKSGKNSGENDKTVMFGGKRKGHTERPCRSVCPSGMAALFRIPPQEGGDVEVFAVELLGREVAAGLLRAQLGGRGRGLRLLRALLLLLLRRLAGGGLVV